MLCGVVGGCVISNSFELDFFEKVTALAYTNLFILR